MSRTKRMRPASGLPEVAGVSLSPELRGQAAHGAADDAISRPSALGANADKGGHRLIRNGRPVVLGVPLGTGSAHVIELGPVRIEQASRQAVRELGEIGQYARRHAVRSAASSRLFHDPLRSTLRLTGSPVSLRLDPLERPFAADCRAEFVKRQYEFACDFSFVAERCRKATVRVKDRCN